MNFESNISLLYSDTQLPDVFITEYLPSMDGDFIKVYIYCLFMSKHNRKASAEDLSKKLELDITRVNEALTYLEGLDIICRKPEGIVLLDLKEKEIHKIYRMKTTSSPEEVALSMERNKKRNKIISAINKTFFQGVMSPSWYTDIDAWFDKYKFEEDVMYALFQHCYDYKGLAKGYITKVADNWHSKNIKNSFDLDRYFIQYQKLKDIRLNIVKKLKLIRNLTEYEEEYVEKWVIDYEFGFDTIELALKKTTGKTNPSFKYIHTILTHWHEQDLKTRDEILAYEKQNKEAAAAKKQSQETVRNAPRGNFKQRKYDDEYFNSLYETIEKG